MGWQTTAHPFVLTPQFRAVAHLPREQMLAELRKPEVRRALVEGNPIPEEVPEDSVIPVHFLMFLLSSHSKMFPMGTEQDYEPGPEQSIAGLAASTGKNPMEIIYDSMMAEDGHGLLYFPLFGYAHGDFEAIRETIQHPQTGLSLADGGAHCGAICDAGIPTFMLTHWARDRRRGEKLPLEFVIRRQTLDTATQYGLGDRGRLAPGLRADLNVIDFDALRLRRPEVRFDLPAGGRRLFQGAEGYQATIVDGQVTYENGEPTGVLPGRLIRGMR